MPTAAKSILILGCFDTKGEDFTFLYQCIRAQGKPVITVNTGVMQSQVAFPVDFSCDTVASEGGHDIHQLREKGDRGYAVEIMGVGAANIVAKLVKEKKISAAIGMGGGGGTFITLTAMQQIPLGIPKLCLSTLAGKDVSRRIGSKDITLMPSIVDVAGLNSISRLMISQAAAAICGMADVIISDQEDVTGRIAISMFGNTNACVGKCSGLLKEAGYEVFTFHANGVGGRTMESLIRENYFDAILDVTTTELADELCGGICSAGPGRLDAAAKVGIPQVVAPGCLDMVNFAQADTVPERYRGRQLYSWTPDVTLMRTNEQENQMLGELVVDKLSRSAAPVSILLPTKGISEVDKEGGIFYRPETDQVLFDAIKNKASGKIKVVELDAHINDEIFSTLLVSELLEMIKTKKNF